MQCYEQKCPYGLDICLKAQCALWGRTSTQDAEENKQKTKRKTGPTSTQGKPDQASEPDQASGWEQLVNQYMQEENEMSEQNLIFTIGQVRDMLKEDAKLRKWANQEIQTYFNLAYPFHALLTLESIERAKILLEIDAEAALKIQKAGTRV